MTIIGTHGGRPFLDGLARSLVDSGNDDFSVFEQDLPANSPPVPAHVHDRYDEAFYVLAGRVWFSDGFEDREVGTGGFVMIRKGVRHRFWNPTSVDARVLVIGHPRVQALVEEIAPFVRRGDFGAVAAAFARHDSRLVD